jgi:Ca2+:H+ antiporter
LPLWKPALYKKDRSVQRAAESAVHSAPSALLYITPDNVIWLCLVGWWTSLLSLLASLPLLLVPNGGDYARVLRGLAWYLFWPFGRYVEKITDDRWSYSVTEEMRNEWEALERGLGRYVLNDDEEHGLFSPADSGGTRGIRQTPSFSRRVINNLRQLGISGCLYYLIYYLIIGKLLN